MHGRQRPAGLPGRGQEADRGRARGRAGTQISARFAALGSALKVARELNATGEVTKRWNANSRLQGGRPWAKGDVYKVLANRVYLGQAVHKGVAYPGEHAAVVDQDLWDRAHTVMTEPTRHRAATTRAQVPMLLKGLIFGPNGRAMSPSHTTRRGRVHRYDVTREAMARGLRQLHGQERAGGGCRGGGAGAGAAALDHARDDRANLGRHKGRAGGARGSGPARRLRLLVGRTVPGGAGAVLKLLVERVDVQADGLEVRLRAEGLASLVAELRQQPATAKAA